jgi:agmatine deiminase
MKLVATQTPAALGYRWPAEWEPHAATWLAWPHNVSTWPGKFEPVPVQFARFVRTLAQFEMVHVLAGGDAVMSQAKSYVGDLPNVTLHDIETNDAWTRDHGPTFLVGPPELPPALIDWQYNAWGGKYPPFDKDNVVPRQIADKLGRRRFDPGIVLEGGAIDGNGSGTILTTEQCLLNPNRNPELSRAGIERYLTDYLGAKKILWLNGGGIAGDDTDGHIDQLARFVGATTVVAALEEDPRDDNDAPLQENFRQLQAMTDQEGRPLTVVPLLMPQPKFYNDQRLPACYLNFYIANGVVIVPTFDDPADELAIATLAQLFPDRQVLGSPALDLVWGLGAFHCMTQQEPACSALES